MPKTANINFRTAKKTKCKTTTIKLQNIRLKKKEKFK